MVTEDTLTALRNRYAEPEIPKCGICGGELSIQRSGGGSPTIWACSGMIDDPIGERTWIYAEGRSMADDHYERSRWTDYRRGGDSDVIDLINAYQSLSTQPASPALNLPDAFSPHDARMFCAAHGVTGAYELASQMANYAVDKVKRLNSPHTAPIEPICATGGAEWVKVSERMPETGQEVLIRMPVCEYFNIENATYKGDGKFTGAWCSSRGDGCSYKVTHWMTRPAEPEEE